MCKASYIGPSNIGNAADTSDRIMTWIEIADTTFRGWYTSTMYTIPEMNIICSASPMKKHAISCDDQCAFPDQPNHSRAGGSITAPSTIGGNLCSGAMRGDEPMFPDPSPSTAAFCAASHRVLYQVSVNQEKTPSATITPSPTARNGNVDAGTLQPCAWKARGNS